MRRSRGRVGVSGLRRGGVVVRAIAVEVPSVSERVAVGIAGAGAVEADRKGSRTAGRVGRRARNGGWFPPEYWMRRIVPPPMSA